MPAEITMPQLSDTMTEGTLVKWLKKEGDSVKANEVIVEIETDKATMEYEAPEAGVIALIAAKAGEKVAVGGLIAVIATKGEDAAAVKKLTASVALSNSSAGKSEASGPKSKVAPVSAGSARGESDASQAVTDDSGESSSYEDAASGEMHEPTGVAGHGATRSAPQAVPPVRHGASGNGDTSERVRVSPLARRIAAEKGIELSRLRGSGPNGRIVRDDVLKYKEPAPMAAARGGDKKRAPLAVPAISPGEKQVVAMTKMRTAIAAALQRSKQQIPHFYETIHIDVEDVSTLRRHLNISLERLGMRLSVADFINKAIAMSLIAHPALNARFNSEKGEVVRYGDVNLGMAVAIPDGLIVPVLRGAQAMGLKELRTRSQDLIDRARAQRLKKDEQTEGTFTVSSLGTFGISEFSAIINPPEVGILAIGSAEPRAVVRSGQIVARTMLTATLSCDHRVVDGATAAEFLRTFKGVLEEPGMLLD